MNSIDSQAVLLVKQTACEVSYFVGNDYVQANNTLIVRILIHINSH